MSIADYGFAIWETFYVTVLSTAFALVLGLPLGVLLVAGDKDGVLPLPGWLMHILNIVINILRSVPFLILMICVFPLTRVIVGTTVGTKATIVPLVVAAFPFVARLVETSLRELDEGVVEAAQSMGATPFQIITKVMIPECLPGLISSMTTALTTILGYSAMSGVIGGGGLGKIALSYGYYRYQTDIMIVCVILLVLMVQVFQSAGTFWATRSVLGIAELARKVYQTWREYTPNRARGVRITVSTSWFVPKPHTAFQWDAQIPVEEYQRRVDLLRDALRRDKSITYNWHDPETSYLEAIFSRGDRRLADVLEYAWNHGAKLDSWSEYFDFQRWMDALSACGLDGDFYAHRVREKDEVFPWAVPSVGVSRDFLWHERELCYQSITTPDCRTRCSGCGANHLLTGGGRCG